MSEDFPEVRNFWDDFNKAYYEWGNLYMQFACCPTEDERYDFFFTNRMLIQEYCSKHFHAQNCTQCDDLCEIHNIKPCRKIWTGLSEECCRTCDLFVADCEVKECPVQSTFSSDYLDDLLPIPPVPVNATSSSYGNNEDFRDSNLYYVLVILLSICCFIGLGINSFLISIAFSKNLQKSCIACMLLP